MFTYVNTGGGFINTGVKDMNWLSRWHHFLWEEGLCLPPPHLCSYRLCVTNRRLFPGSCQLALGHNNHYGKEIELRKNRILPHV